jgi:NitT/TauT family transport system permease protein
VYIIGMGQIMSWINKKKYSFVAIIFWIVTWQVASMVVNTEMLFASPFAVIKVLSKLLWKQDFWTSIANSFIKIVIGFILAMILGIILAVISYCSRLFREIISPFIKVIKAIPVASFIILALLWIRSENLSILISFFMVIPIVYTNVLQGLTSTDRKLLEMATVFRLNKLKKVRYIYIPAVLPYFISAISVGLGFCWKSGIAAEIIGLPKNSIGENLYYAKLYLMTDELFAWTIVIILISIFFEKIVLYLIEKMQRMVTNG